MITAVVICALVGALAVAIPAVESSEIEVVSMESQVGYEALMAGDHHRAIAEIEANRALAHDDPARLINLGVAYANSGDELRARGLFRAAIGSADQMELETSLGDWVYSRALARRALNMLDTGTLSNARIAVR